MKKIIEVLDNDLIAAIKSDADLSGIRIILLEYKNRGFQSQEVEEFLSDFLSDVRTSDSLDALEEKILEVLDMVTDFCSPFLKVWEN